MGLTGTKTEFVRELCVDPPPSPSFIEILCVVVQRQHKTQTNPGYDE